MTRKEYQKQYQKEYAESGKKSEAAKRYYQKHKYDICDRKIKKKEQNSLKGSKRNKPLHLPR